jgi:hypothetical protein
METNLPTLSARVYANLPEGNMFIAWKIIKLGLLDFPASHV